jgi:acyl transferase domain-containing protein
MAEWSSAAGAGTSSFGMSGTNAYALAVHPVESHTKSPAKPFKWQRLRRELLCT